jgi:hypothetical protein
MAMDRVHRDEQEWAKQGWRGGYYYDHLQRRWMPKFQPGPETPQGRRRLHRRRLLPELLTEIGGGSALSRLYASLLARALIAEDEELMREHGEQVCKLTGEEQRAGI